MVADSLITGSLKSAAAKIYRVHDYLVGVAGRQGTWQRLLAKPWPKKPTEKRMIAFYEKHIQLFEGEESCSVLVATAKEVFEIEGQVLRCPVGLIGSGSIVARGYLRARPGDIEGAIETAIELDPSCGGPLVVERC